MKIVINPYIGYSDNLADLVAKFGGILEKPKCSDGLCPIQIPVKLMTKKKINELVQTQAEQAEQAEQANGQIDLIIVSLIDKDQLALVKMSRAEGWGSLKGVNVKIVCDAEAGSIR